MSHRHMSLSPECLAAVEGTKWPRGWWEPPLSLHPIMCHLCTSAGVTTVQSLHLPERRYYSGAHLELSQPAAKAGLPSKATLDRMVTLSSAVWQGQWLREGNLHLWNTHLVCSHKHKAPGCIAFQASAVLEKVQRSGMSFPDWRQQRYHLVSQWVTETRERQFTREIRRSN